jgi:hypothetical protein
MDVQMNEGSEIPKSEAIPEARATKVQTFLKQNQSILEGVFEDLQSRAIKEHSVDVERHERRRTFFRELLDDYYHRSEHLSVTWEEVFSLLFVIVSLVLRRNHVCLLHPGL